ncbi:MAG: hypothetical protein IPG79_12640 [Saprospiraceae bacterium]|nr:hypothetical protein [Saprospiraceae bacterium]
MLLVLLQTLLRQQPPTTPSSYSIGGSLSGSFNVGTAQVYTTLTAAIAAYNTSCLTGPVTFLLTDAAYTEAAAMTINANADASATNTLTIKPTLANTTIAVTGGSATAILTLNGADFVTIDGSNSGGTDKSLTIENTASTSNSTVIWVSSLGTGAGATNNTIKNCNIKGGNIVTNTASFGILPEELPFPMAEQVMTTTTLQFRIIPLQRQVSAFMHVLPQQVF